MRICRNAAAIAGLLILSQVGFAPDAVAAIIPNPDGKTLHDTILQVTWARNMNLAGSPQGQARLTDPLMVGHFVSSNGAMNFNAALAWVGMLNSYSYLGRTTWQLPATPHTDATCSSPVGADGNSFAYNCTNNAMGSLFYQSLQLQGPDTAVPIPTSFTGPFRNFQPYLYWSGTPRPMLLNDWYAFSFNTGWQGSNVDQHYMYVLPMISGQWGTYSKPPVVGNLLLSDDGKTVYDPFAYDPETYTVGVTWLANANYAVTQEFGAQCTFTGPQANLNFDCINGDGSMSHTAAVAWIAGMNAHVAAPGAPPGFLGSNQWKLPPIDVADPCMHPNFNCTNSPMGHLFYELGLMQGEPAVPTPTLMNDTHLQPYLYWSCVEDAAVPRACDYADHADLGLEFSFSFGNGYLGTTVVRANNYVMVYFRQTTLEAVTEALTAVYGPTGTAPNAVTLSNAITHANAIVTALPAQKAALISKFVQFLNGQRGLTLTDAQAGHIRDLVQAL